MMQYQGQTAVAPDAEQFRTVLHQHLVHATKGNRAEFCRQLGLGGRALNGWLTKGERPSFSQFMVVCYGLDIMPSQIFGASPRNERGVAVRSSEKLVTRKSSPKPCEAELNVLERRLQDAVAARQGLPVARIARELGVSVSLLRYRFPNLCARLSQICRELRTQKAIRHQRQQAERVAAIVKEVRAAGDYPSRRRVDTALRREGMSLAQPHLKLAYKNALADERLGPHSAARSRDSVDLSLMQADVTGENRQGCLDFGSNGRGRRGAT
jgi:AraC-like DNA-binding protein